MKKRILLVALLLFAPRLMLAQGFGGDAELGRKYAYDGIVCTSEDAMKKIAEAYARGGQESMNRTSLPYVRDGTCSNRRTSVILIARLSPVEGKSVTMTIYQAITESDKDPVYLPIAWVSPAFNCVPEKGVCS